MKILSRYIVFFLCCFISIGANSPEKNSSNLEYSTSTYSNINNLSTVFFNNGYSDIDVNDNSSGLEYPKGSGSKAIFKSGLLWGIYNSADLAPKVGGSAYRTGLQPGKILNNGIAEYPDEEHIRIYRVRRDVYPSGPDVDLSHEAAEEGITQEAVREQYEKDWNEWRAEDGAPFTDNNGNNVYDPAVDIPGVENADQTIWYVANDLDPTRTQFLYGSNPIGIELQVTVWSYHQSGVLDNIIFRQYRMINKSGTTLENMYVTLWADTEIGESTNDFAGCDTTLNLGYGYNASVYDEQYGLTPAGVGINFLKTPLNSGMTAFYYFGRGDPAVTDPTQGNPDGAAQFYNFMQGKIGLTGEYFQNPHTGENTTYALNGNPLTNEGWIDGQLIGASDRRIGIASGSFEMAVGDTQDVVVSEIAAVGFDNLHVIRLLRYYASLTEDYYNNSFNFTRTPFPETITPAASQINKSIKLEWNSTSENFSEDGFEFQGYNIYQLNSEFELKSNAIRIATFDKVDGITNINGIAMNPTTGYAENGTLQFGSDSGLQTEFTITQDYVTGTYLIPGKPYYFAVTAYAYNSNATGNSNNTESLLNVIEVKIEEDNVLNYGSTLNVSQIAGDGEGKVEAVVTDGYQLTGHQYKISIDSLSNGDIVWNFYDVNLQTLLLENQTDFSGSAVTSPIIDGMQIRISEISGVKRLSMISNGNGIVPNIFGYDVTTPPSFNAFSADWYRDVLLGEGGSTHLTNGMQAAGGSYFIVAGHQNIENYESALNRWTRNGTLWPILSGNNYEIRFTARNNKGVWPMGFANHITPGTYSLPFELWFVGDKFDDESDDVRMIPVILDEADTVGTPTEPTWGFELDHSASSLENDPSSDWIYFYMPEDQTPGETGYQNAINLNPANRENEWTEHLARLALMNWDQQQGNGGVNELPEEGTVFRIEFPKPFMPGEDVFTIDQVTDILDDGEIPLTYSLQQNYPNPFNPSTTINFSLPKSEKVKLEIFNLLGEKISTLVNKEMSFGNHSIKFNGSNLSSGVYFYVIKIGNKFFEAKKMMLIK